ncbi:MAG: CBS domain-containing protein [candidate division Zixibacteria bacterium]|nr:CBS domain-containing protein [candidate division Zixibacteria bacterium]
MKVKEILESRKAPITIHAEKHLQDAMRLLIDHKIGSLIVVDDEDKPSGIITEHDIFHLAYRFRGDMMDMVVGDNMTKNLVLASPDDSLNKIADIMMEKHIRHIPITDDSKKLLGIISIRDLVGYLRG